MVLKPNMRLLTDLISLDKCWLNNNNKSDTMYKYNAFCIESQLNNKNIVFCWHFL